MSDEIKVKDKKRLSHLIIFISIGVILALAIIAVVLVYSDKSRAKKEKEQLSLGEKYLSELEYERAVAVYEQTTPLPVSSFDTTTDSVIERRQIQLELTADCFTYEDSETEYICTGLSEKGYAEFKKYDENCCVSVSLPAVSDSGETVAGFISRSDGGYDLPELLTEDSAYIELVCPETYTVYYGVCDEKPNEKYMGKLLDVVLNEGMVKIGRNAFEGCIGLTKFTVPDSVSVIESKAFADCTELEIENLEVGGRTLGYRIFRGATINKLVVSDTVQADSLGSLGGATINEVEIKEGVKEVSDYLFMDCGDITGVELPTSIERIGIRAFSNCEALSKLTIPERVTEIGDYAFSGCTKLVIENLDVGRRTLGYRTFCGVIINKLTVSDAVQATANGSLEEAIIDVVEIKEGVKEVSDGLFKDCKSVQRVELPEGVERIGWSAFSGCEALEELIIPQSVTVIEKGAISKCEKLVIFTEKDSYAATYAEENKIQVQYR